MNIRSKIDWEIIKVRRHGEDGRDTGTQVVKKEPEPDLRGDDIIHTVEALLSPLLVPMTRPATDRRTKWRAEPKVTLSADSPDGEPAREFRPALPALPVEVAAVAVPTILAVFSEVEYNRDKDGGRLVVVPTNGAVQLSQGSVDDVNALLETLREVRGVIGKLKALTQLAWVAGLPTGLTKLEEALRPAPTGGHKLLLCLAERKWGSW